MAAAAASNKAAVVRQYEQLLMHRSRFVLADVVRVIQQIVHALERTRSLLRDARQRATSSSPRRPPLRSTKFQDVLASVARRADVLASQVPLFLGEQEVAVLLRGLRDFTRHASSDLEYFWDLELDAQKEKGVTDELTAVLQNMTEMVSALERAATRSAPVMHDLRTKREHLIKLVDESLLLVAQSNSFRLAKCEADRDQLMKDFQEALGAKELVEANHLKYELSAIETILTTMLSPHAEISRTITTANAHVQRGVEFPKDARRQIKEFVLCATAIKSEDADYHIMLADIDRFLQQLTIFERAAKQDAFLVCSSVLKLQFEDTVDQELFRAYGTDWMDKKDRLQMVELSAEYIAAKHRIVELTTEIQRVEALSQTRRKNLLMDDPIKIALKREVENVFQDEGGEVGSLVDVFS